MKLNSIYFNMLRAKPKAQKTSVNLCFQIGCKEAGIHRAPKRALEINAPDEPGNSNWVYFCKTHIEQYNKNYDFFANMTPEQIFDFQKNASFGHRPMWRLGALGPKKFIQPNLRSYFNFFDKKNYNKTQQNVRPPKMLPGQLKALQTMGLTESATNNEIKTRFKFLVKRYHPDLNGSRRKYENRLVAVIQSYNELRKRF